MSFTLTNPGRCFCHWTLNLIFLEPQIWPCPLPHPIWSNQPPLSAIWILLFSFSLSHFSLRWSWHFSCSCMILNTRTVFCIYMNKIIRCEMNKASLENAAHYLSLESPNLHYILMLLRSPSIKRNILNFKTSQPILNTRHHFCITPY